MECEWCGNIDLLTLVFSGERVCRECYKDVHKCNSCGAETHVDDLTDVSDEYYCADCVDNARSDHERACVEHSNHIASTNAWLDSERGGR